MLFLFIPGSTVLAALVAILIAHRVAPDALALWAAASAALTMMWWASRPRRIVAAYLRGEVEVVRNSVRLWRDVWGAKECELALLQAAIESGRKADADAACRSLATDGVGPFARAWSQGLTQLYSGQPVQAVAAWVKGMETTYGFDRAELACESALVFLQSGGVPPTRMNGEALEQVIDLIRQAGRLEQTTDVGTDYYRKAYVAAFVAGLRGFLLWAQGREREAAERLRSAADEARRVRGIRAQRLALIFDIESVGAARSSIGSVRYRSDLDRYASQAVPAHIRQRLATLLLADTTSSETIRAQVTAAKDSRSSVP